MRLNLDKLAQDLTSSHRRAIAKAITLVESSLEDDQLAAEALLTTIMPQTGKSMRIGISGIPGVGKSTFIEALGNLLLRNNEKVAVLAVDPSSPISGGSILGDRTRMQQLGSHESAFVRPSPAGETLGGVARRTLESSLILEAAGYNNIIIETVGVGQSEYAVHSMVDVFIMLQMPKTGDGLQGIKKGVLELADIVVINKADGELTEAAELAQSQHQKALSFIHGEHKDPPPVLLCSSLKQSGVEEIYQKILEFIEKQKNTGSFLERRNEQTRAWFERELPERLLEEIKKMERIKPVLSQQKKAVLDGLTPASVAAKKVVREVLKS